MSDPKNTDPRLEIPETLRKPVDFKPGVIQPPSMSRGDASSQQAEMAKGWAIAMNFAFSVAGMGLLGWALQKWVWPGATPWLMLACLLVGIVGGFVQFVRAAMAANR